MQMILGGGHTGEFKSYSILYSDGKNTAVQSTVSNTVSTTCQEV